MPTPTLGDLRRGFLRLAGGGLAMATGAAIATSATQLAGVRLQPMQANTEAPDPTPVPEQDDRRVGFAIVGLGHLALNQILPAFGTSKLGRPVAFVSGNRAKAKGVALEYDIPGDSIYGYDEFEKIATNEKIKAVYIVLPNAMHAEFTVRAARSGKHVLCEKPMATNVGDCRKMIAACQAAKRHLMIAYRSQYEPMDRSIFKMIANQELGILRQFVASNVQNQGDPQQWRLKKAMSGGGALVDVGIYCLNAARFLSGEEPTEVLATIVQPEDDPRFTEVEESCNFILRFPSGLIANCVGGYGSHSSKYFRMQGSDAWAEMNPAFGYSGLKTAHGRLIDSRDTTMTPHFSPADQFALELDHFSQCVTDDVMPHTPGEEGLQDQIIVEAIYASAREGRSVSIPAPGVSTRGPEPKQLT